MVMRMNSLLWRRLVKKSAVIFRPRSLIDSRLSKVLYLKLKKQHSPQSKRLKRSNQSRRRIQLSAVRSLSWYPRLRKKLQRRRNSCLFRNSILLIEST